MTDSASIIAQENRYLAHNYKPLPVVLARGEGVWVWDVEGRKYLDCLSAYSALSAGHLHPRIRQAAIGQLSRMDVPCRAFYSDQLGPFAEALCSLTGMDMMLPMNTGAEAVETAIKAARRWGYRVKGIPADKARIIVADGNFHGRTTTIVGFSSEVDYRKDFGPFADGFDRVAYGDPAAVEAAITPHTCAVLFEPMQGEAGIIIPPRGWLSAAQAICRKNNVLLILDEIQTGLGRTGRDFAFQHEIDKPDALILGKALGGGIYPVSAFLARRDVMELFEPGSHGSTFGGNPVGCAIGIEALKLLRDEKLSERSAELGAYLKDQLIAFNAPMVTEVRGAGLWIGIEIDPAFKTARAICESLQQRGVLCKETHHTVVRLAPPLTITRDEIDWVLDQLRPVLSGGD